MTRRLIAGDGYVNSLINHCSECHKVFHPVAIVSGVIAAVPGNESRIAGRTDVHPGHSLNQIQISNGTMLDSVSGFRSWVCPEGMLITLHHEFYRQITHCMCRCLTVRIINLPDIFTNFLPFPGEYPRHVRVMAVRFSRGTGWSACASVNHEFTGTQPAILIAKSCQQAQSKQMLIFFYGKMFSINIVNHHIFSWFELSFSTEFLHDFIR